MVLTVGRRQNWIAILEISSKSFPLIPQNTRDIRGFRKVLEVRSVRLMVSNRSNTDNRRVTLRSGDGIESDSVRIGDAGSLLWWAWCVTY